ncbi:hypothetical protein E2P81_ATG11940 [Venturia nashicola]|nr:hypothetical protein E2P81_ATG11940 [Venturia nashicola]
MEWAEMRSAGPPTAMPYAGPPTAMPYAGPPRAMPYAGPPTEPASAQKVPLACPTALLRADTVRRPRYPSRSPLALSNVSSHE